MQGPTPRSLNDEKQAKATRKKRLPRSRATASTLRQKGHSFKGRTVARQR